MEVLATSKGAVRLDDGAGSSRAICGNVFAHKTSRKPRARIASRQAPAEQELWGECNGIGVAGIVYELRPDPGRIEVREQPRHDLETELGFEPESTSLPARFGGALVAHPDYLAVEVQPEEGRRKLQPIPCDHPCTQLSTERCGDWGRRIGPQNDPARIVRVKPTPKLDEEL